METASKLLGLGVCLVVALTVACSNQPGSPVSPSGVAGATVFDESEANPDGSLLKTNAPSLMSPVNNVRVDTLTPTLTTGHVTGKYASSSFSYEFELYDGSTRIATTTLPSSAGSSTSWTLPSSVTLGIDKQYSWRTRPVTAGVSGLVTGPWSPMGTFLSLDEPASFNNATGLYDTLFDGKTIGTRVGPTTFIPGVGIRLDDFSSYVQYTLPQTLTAGEFSIIVTNIGWNTEGGKTKIMAMADSAADITTSEYRATYEKRGDPAGVIAWRFRYGGGRQIDTEGAERVQLAESQLNDRGTYLWRVTWGNGVHCLEIFRFSNGQVQGGNYSSCKGYSGTYRPTPHNIFLGSPSGRAGVTDASVPGIIIRRVWVSATPRPLYANRN